MRTALTRSVAHRIHSASAPGCLQAAEGVKRSRKRTVPLPKVNQNRRSSLNDQHQIQDSVPVQNHVVTMSLVTYR